MTTPPKPKRVPASPLKTPRQRVLHKAFDEIDADYDPTVDYAEIASRVRQEESAW